jgi:hypothetical protein
MQLTRRPVIAGALALSAGAAYGQNAPFEGEWHGALDINATVRLRLRLVVERPKRQDLQSRSRQCGIARHWHSNFSRP